jgi:penicillin-binding protein 3
VRHKKYLFLSLILFVFIFSFIGCSRAKSPKDSFEGFVKLWQENNYASMYKLLSSETKKTVDEKYFIDTYKNIYGTAKVSKVSVIPKYPDELKADNSGKVHFPVNITVETPIGAKQFTYEVNLVQEKIDKNKEWLVAWDEKMLLPELEKGDKIYFNKSLGKRGEIKDKNGKGLAINSQATSIYVIPQEIAADRDNTVAHLASTLGMTVEQIEAILNQQWVKNNPNQRVPILDVPRDEMPKILKAQEPKGVKGEISPRLLRRYPAGEAAAHIIGYIGQINAEELKTKKDLGYDESDYIGRSGLESIFESRLRGEVGGIIYTTDSKDKKKSTILEKPAKDGETVTLTIDSNLQREIYAQFAGDSGTSVAVQPKTGEVLAMVSSPSFDPNKFVTGLSSKEYKDLEGNPEKPFLRRYESAIVPGSVFKPITAAIGLKSGKLKPESELKIQGESWQKDASWGKYNITRVSTADESVNLLDAFVRSDNIYFAQTALAITKDEFLNGVKDFGIGEKLPFILNLAQSQIGKLEKDVELADSGYGQDKVLMNPLHLALIYSSFVNEGNILSPVLDMKDKTEAPKIWKEKVFSKEIADTILKDLTQVVENPNGTAHSAQISGLTYAGKTGTAEIKKSQEDITGTENGWYAAVNTDNPKLAVVMMIENVKDRGGSHYVLPKVQSIMSKFGR